MFEPDVRVVARDLRDGLAPQLRYLEHVRLVHRCDQPPAAPGGVERHARDALDLGGGIRQRVHGAFPVTPARLSIVEPARELAHDEQIDPAQPVGFERRAPQQRRMNGHRPQVGKHFQQLAQGEQAGLGAQLARRTIERGISYRAEQHGIAVCNGGACRGWQRIVGRCDGRRTHGEGREREAKVEPFADRLERAHSLRGHFRPDPVARQHRYRVRLHEWLRSYAAMLGSSSSVRPISSRPRSNSSRP